MKQDSFLRRLLAKFRSSAKPADKTPKAPETPKASGEPKRPRTDSSFEPLEGRIAPAVLLNATTIQFTDTDGDLVTVKFSKPLFQPGSTGLNDKLDAAFIFKDGGTVRLDGSNTQVHELAMLDLASLAAIGTVNPATGSNISITAEKQGANGDGLVNVGYIRAASSSIFGVSLGNVVVEGDLGQIDAGDRTKTVGIASLTVNSWGKLGVATQPDDTASFDPSLESNVTSSIGKITVLGDFQDAILRVVNGDIAARNPGKIGSITIGGDIVANATTNNAALISTDGGIGSIKANDIIGGQGQNSGKITAGAKIGAVTLTGDLRGGVGKDSGQIDATDGIGKVVLRDLWAGAGENSGRFQSDTGITSVTLHAVNGHHSFTGGDAGKNGGTIAAAGNIGAITIGGNISGGKNEGSGKIAAGGTIAKLTVGGHIIGGEGIASGQILSNSSMGPVVVNGLQQGYASIEVTPGAEGVQEKHAINLGDVLGRGGTFTLSYEVNGTAQTTTALSGSATAAEIQAALTALPGIGANGATVAINGGRVEITFAAAGAQAGTFSASVTQASIVGGLGTTSGSVISNGHLGKVTVKNAVTGAAAMKAGVGLGSGSISATGNIGAIVLNGDVDGSTTGALETAASISASGNIASVTLTGSLLGGAGELTAAIVADGTIGAIKVNGSLFGGAGDNSASIIAGGKISSALVTGSLDGGAGANSASLVAGNDITRPGDFGRVTVLGNLLGEGDNSASVRAGGKLGAVVLGTLNPDALANVLSGGAGHNSASVVGERGITSLTINGHVVGGAGINSATIQGGLNIASVKIAGNLQGGVGDLSGSIAASDVPNGIDLLPGNIGTVTVLGSLTGNTGDDSGQIRAAGSIKSITIGALTGNNGSASGSIISGIGDAAFFNDYQTIGTIGSIVVKGAINAGTGLDSGKIQSAAKLGALTVNGTITGTHIFSGRDIGSITVNGSVDGALISAQGSAKATTRADLTIGKVTVTGNVESTIIRAGYDVFGNAVNGNAQIGTVTVKANWIASSIAAGVIDEEGDGFGDEDDDPMFVDGISKIASIVIGGTVTGTSTLGDSYGFVAATIAKVKIGTVTHALTPGVDTIALAGDPETNDTSIREVP